MINRAIEDDELYDADCIANKEGEELSCPHCIIIDALDMQNSILDAIDNIKVTTMDVFTIFKQHHVKSKGGN